MNIQKNVSNVNIKFYLSNGYLIRLNYCTIINSHWFYGFAKQNISCFFFIYL